MAKMEWQLDDGTRDCLLTLLLENRELRAIAEKEHESWLFWFKRCEELEDAVHTFDKKVPDYKDIFPNEYKEEEEK